MKMKKTIKFMKSNYRIILPIILLAGILLSFTIKQKTNPEKDRVLLGLIRYALTQGHYEPKNLNDEFSKIVFDDFINDLDPTRRFFTQIDIKQFSLYKDKIDDQIRDEDLAFYNLVHMRFQRHLQDAKGFYKEILKYPFDFSRDDTLDIDYKKKAFPKNDIELILNWQKQLKLITLSRLNDKLEAQEDKIKEDPNFKPKSFAELEIESRKATEESLGDTFIRMNELDDNDWFSFFINSITEAFDPHTSYFAPKVKKRFDMDMSGKLEGIGARLQKSGNYTKVVEIISGGPAWRAGQLQVGDLILKVAQADQEPIDIVGMRLDDAIEFIKGKKGTEVRLTIKKLDGITETIAIIRDIVELDETFAKTSIIERNGRKFGVINLPKFYIDFSKKNFRNSATDMAFEIEQLKKENVEGLLLDLRNNGGGSLETAIDIAGLFIKEGPVVQVKYREVDQRVRYDKDKKIQWDKPLVVLVNELSASASEIFAAAMQDYNRAVIIGSKQTFGKGTVQNILPLNNYYKYPEDLGALKMTIQKFYRINGGSTQLKGVESDVKMPDRYSYLSIGERDEESPLEWDKIESAMYRTWNEYENFDEVVNNSKIRIADNPQFKLIDKNAKWLKEGQDDSLVYLKYSDYKKDLEKRDKESKEFKSIYDYQNNLTFFSPKYELPFLEKDSVLAKKREVWHKNLSKDIYIEEGLNILSELKIKNYKILVKN
jgi:carboxyl-terminal processing protease